MGMMLDLPGLLTWWKSLKPGWRWTVGLVPLVLVATLIGLYKLMERRTVDPTEAADTRAAEEEKRRTTDLKKAEERLKVEVEAIKQKAATEDKKDDVAAADKVRELAKDPDALIEAARRVGQGGKL